MKIHELKTLKEYFWDVWNDKKSFEVRFNDRDYKVGDVLNLKWYIPESNEYMDYSILCEVLYILDDPQYCKGGYVILGIKVLGRFEK